MVCPIHIGTLGSSSEGQRRSAATESVFARPSCRPWRSAPAPRDPWPCSRWIWTVSSASTACCAGPSRQCCAGHTRRGRGCHRAVHPVCRAGGGCAAPDPLDVRAGGLAAGRPTHPGVALADIGQPVPRTCSAPNSASGWAPFWSAMAWGAPAFVWRSPKARSWTPRCALRRWFNRLSEQGFELSIDNFGTGYSLLASALHH